MNGESDELHRIASAAEKALATRLRPPLPPPYVADYRPYTATLHPSAVRVYVDCASNWNQYYRNNTINGYRDRHYISREFRELDEALRNGSTQTQDPDDERPEEGERERAETTKEDVLLVEIGCGVGNTFLPLLEAHKNLRVVAVDISAVAVSLLRDECTKRRVAERCQAGVVDISSSTIPRSLLPTAGDFASLVFVLCSVPVELHAAAVQHVAASLRVGGVLFFRDYAAGDMAQRRFAAAGEKRSRVSGVSPSDNLSFSRSNGTLTHFFTADEIERLFLSSPRIFTTCDMRLVDRVNVNRRHGTEMPRLWWQCRFRKA